MLGKRECFTKMSDETEYYLVMDDKEQGPFTIGQLRSLWNAGKITSKTYYFQPGMIEWKPLAQVVTRLEPPPTKEAEPTIIKTAKSRGVYIILGIFFGTLGIHNFYAGYNSKGASQIIVWIIAFVAEMAGMMHREPGFNPASSGNALYDDPLSALPALGFCLLMVLLIWVILDLWETTTDAKGDPLA
jgi:hypothetical protein